MNQCSPALTMNMNHKPEPTTEPEPKPKPAKSDHVCEPVLMFIPKGVLVDFDVMEWSSTYPHAPEVCTSCELLDSLIASYIQALLPPLVTSSPKLFLSPLALPSSKLSLVKLSSKLSLTSLSLLLCQRQPVPLPHFRCLPSAPRLIQWLRRAARIRLGLPSCQLHHGVWIRQPHL